MSEPPVLVLITGWPGAGKSALADVAGAAPAAPRNGVAELQGVGLSHARTSCGAAVLGWDWVMGALTPFEPVQQAIGEMDRPTYRAVGWSVLWSLAESELRRSRSVVLDGVARAEEIAAGRTLAARYGADSLVVWCECSDAAQHQSRVVGRQRNIPGWHELAWLDVAVARDTLERPADVDLVLDATEDWDANVDRLHQFLASGERR